MTVPGVVRSDAGTGSAGYSDLSSVFRDGSLGESIRIAELTRFGGAHPFPGMSERVEGSDDCIGTVPRLLREN